MEILWIGEREREIEIERARGSESGVQDVCIEKYKSNRYIC